MPEKLKNLYFTKESIQLLVDTVQESYGGFDVDKFLALVYDDTWEGLELKAKMHHVTLALHETLSQEFPRALEILRRVAPSIHGFDSMVFPDYVASYGLDHWEISMPALAFFTTLCSSEYAVRCFIARDPQRAMAHLYEWAEDENEHVRRLASEGCRPRLPWGMVLTVFRKDPHLILPVLEKLKDDESEYVRRSVANNLNDISKDHPDLVLDICERWFGQNEQRDGIVKHACRGLLKKGNRRAMLLFGFRAPTHIEVENLTLDREALSIGDNLRYSFELVVSTEAPAKVRLELGVDYVKARGKTSRKVFQIREHTFDPGSHVISRKLCLADQSTRKHYPGEHHISIVVNGVEKARAWFVLKASTVERQHWRHVWDLSRRARPRRTS